METGLPEEPTTLWRESSGSLWAYIASTLALAGNPEQPREVKVSTNGLSFIQGRQGIRGARARFVSWHEIDRIEEADEPDLLNVILADGTIETLDQWNLPRRADFATGERTRRVELVKEAFAAAKPDGSPS